MTIHATFNPIGSTNPKDLIDNAQNLDYLILGPALLYPDRRSVNRLSWAGIEASFAAAQARRESEFGAAQLDRSNRFDAFIASSGYDVIGDYASQPVTFTERNQLMLKDGELWKPKASVELPYVTTGVWGTESVNFVSVGDAALRQELAEPEGSSMSGFRHGGVGAVPRDVQSKLRDIITGADYSTAQHAANAALGKIFFVPDGANVTIGVPAQIATLRAAIDAIDQWSIPTTSTVTINVADGHYYTSQASVLTHPNGERLIINGPVMNQICSITGLAGFSGARGNYIATLSVSSVAGISVGDWLSIREVTGSSGPHKVFNGVYQVTAIGSGTVSVRIRLWSTAFPAMTLTGGKVYRFGAVIHCNSCDGLIVKSSTPTVNYLLFAGNMWDYWSEADILGTEKGTHGVYIGSNTITDGTGTPGGENPYGISGGSLSGVHIGSVDFDQQGFTTAGGSALFGQYLVTSSCGRRGFYVGTAAAMEVKFSVSSTQYRDAAIADYGGTFNTSYFEGNGCRLAGAFSNNGGKVVAPNSNFWFNNIGTDIRAGGTGTFDAGSCKYNIADGAHYEYGAGGSINGADISNNGVDGLSALYSSGVRALNAIIANNGRYNINALGCALGISGSTITGAGVKNINNTGFSDIYDGTNYEPIGDHAAFYELLISDLVKSHMAKMTVGSIGDLSFILDNIARLVLKLDGTLHPSVDGGPSAGRSLNRFSAGYCREYFIGTGSVKDFSGTGSPEGNKSAVVGSTYRREDGGAGTTFYVKESGTGNTGWVTK